MFGMAKMLACLLAVPAPALQSNPRRGTPPPSRALRSDPHGTHGVRLPVFDASLVDVEEIVTAVDAPVAAGAAADELAGAADDNAVALCSRMFARFARGQELLRRNHGVPVLCAHAMRPCTRGFTYCPPSLNWPLHRSHIRRQCKYATVHDV